MSFEMKDIHVGDFVELGSRGLRSLTNPNDEENYFKVLLVNPIDGNLVIKVNHGWIDYDNQCQSWWVDFDMIERIIPAGKGRFFNTNSNVYDPMTSKVKSPEELEQYKKDVGFFFRDLTVPYKAPEGAWAKWS